MKSNILDNKDSGRSAEDAEWAKEVKRRDNGLCQSCKVLSKELQSHHKFSWDRWEKQRLSLANGVTLCKECHQTFHSVFGAGNNDAYQYDNYIEMREFFTNLLTNK